MSFTSLGASVYVLNSSTASILDSTVVQGNDVPFYLSLSENYLFNKIPADDLDFNNIDLWKRVTVFYSPVGSNQQVHFTFSEVNGSLQAYSIVSSYAKKGTWNIQYVMILNKAGVLLRLGSENFSSSDNITMV